VLGACVDTTPYDLHENKDASAVESGVIEGCRQCVVGDGAPCRASYDKCVPVLNCLNFFECALALGCFQLPNLEDRIACGQPCFKKYAVGSADPLIGPIIAVNACSQIACRKECIGP
jgi:hypothetical protein